MKLFVLITVGSLMISENVQSMTSSNYSTHNNDRDRKNVVMMEEQRPVDSINIPNSSGMFLPDLNKISRYKEVSSSCKRKRNIEAIDYSCNNNVKEAYLPQNQRRRCSDTSVYDRKNIDNNDVFLPVSGNSDNLPNKINNFHIANDVKNNGKEQSITAGPDIRLLNNNDLYMIISGFKTADRTKMNTFVTDSSFDDSNLNLEKIPSKLYKKEDNLNPFYSRQLDNIRNWEKRLACRRNNQVKCIRKEAEEELKMFYQYGFRLDNKLVGFLLRYRQKMEDRYMSIIRRLMMDYLFETKEEELDDGDSEQKTRVVFQQQLIDVMQKKVEHLQQVNQNLEKINEEQREELEQKDLDLKKERDLNLLISMMGG